MLDLVKFLYGIFYDFVFNWHFYSSALYLINLFEHVAISINLFSMASLEILLIIEFISLSFVIIELRLSGLSYLLLPETLIVLNWACWLLTHVNCAFVDFAASNVNVQSVSNGEDEGLDGKDSGYG